MPLKKKKSNAGSAGMPAWHLDFRDVSRLPDVKPIRTSFFVNGISLLLAAFVLMNFAKQEFALHNLGSQVTDWQAQIESDSGPSSMAVQDFRKFQVEEKKIEEVKSFLTTKVKPSVFLMRLGEVLPENIIIDMIDWREGEIGLRGTVSGSPDRASGYASSMVALLTADEILGALFSEISLTSLARNPATGLLAMEIRMTLSPVE